MTTIDKLVTLCHRHGVTLTHLSSNVRYKVHWSAKRVVHIYLLPEGKGCLYGTYGTAPHKHPRLGMDVPPTCVAEGRWGVETHDLEEAVTAALPDRIFTDHGTHSTVFRKAYTEKLHRDQAGLCHYCQRRVRLNRATCDHMTPLSRGGQDVPPNMVMSCPDCNLEKDDMTAEEYLGMRTARCRKAIGSTG